MAPTLRSKQLNVELGDERVATALREIAYVRGVTVQDIIRELVLVYVNQELHTDEDLRAGVDALLRSKARRAPAKASVTQLSRGSGESGSNDSTRTS